MGDQPNVLAHRVVLAAAPLRVLPLPTPLRGVIDEALEYVIELSATRSPMAKDRWPEIHRSFYGTVQAYVADPDEVLRALRQPPHTPSLSRHTESQDG